ncbi:hypothetical protein GCM10023346_46760 [Arthrobacter gyeryongensis]|uniref:Multi-ubiquitin domain-containing protein n=1 Tax=Arthrobacter gyeryongensis TaxID=1650592 RepID=A0ABP9SVY4_9MICC
MNELNIRDHVSPNFPESEEKVEKKYEVTINGTLVEVDHDTLTYAELGDLAFPGHAPDVEFAIAYTHANGPHGGSGVLVSGDSVMVKKKGTRFNVRLANRS